MMHGIYLHIPFCKSRCIYCDFFSTTQLAERQRYVDAVCREIGRRAQTATQRQAGTIYIGGGTPSQLTAAQLEQLFDCLHRHYDVASDAEITVEANPDDIHPAFVSQLRDMGVNRLSFGIQTFDDEQLRFIRRRHTARQAVMAVETAQQAGFDNISIDLMFGFPHSTLDGWQRDLHTAVGLGVQHISAYSLMYEAGTRLTQMRDSGQVEEIDEECSLRMYDLLIDRLAEAGFEHYEISNFSQPGRRSRHNASYWQGTPYEGFGAGAHSYDGHTRSWNPSSLPIYIKGVEDGTLSPEREELNESQRYDELVMTRLRTCEGLDLKQLAQQFGPRRHAYCLRMAQSHIDGGRLHRTDDDRLVLTRRGISTSNDVMADLMQPD